jgi:hypothetical protein
VRPLALKGFCEIDKERGCGFYGFSTGAFSTGAFWTGALGSELQTCQLP